MWCPQNSRILTVLFGGPVILWELNANRELERRTLAGSDESFAAAFSLDGKMLAIAGFRRISVCDSRTGDRLTERSVEFPLAPAGLRFMAGDRVLACRLHDYSSWFFDMYASP